MSKRPIFLSFDYHHDVFRVQQIKNMGIIEEQPLLSTNEFEKVKRKGDPAIKNWIDENMKYKQCVIVLIGNDTSNRNWVRYEILKAWENKKPMFGIYIHNLECPNTGYCKKGANPFSILESNSVHIKCHDPSTFSFTNLTIGQAAYRDIKSNISTWIEDAINQREMLKMYDI